MVAPKTPPLQRIQSVRQQPKSSVQDRSKPPDERRDWRATGAHRRRDSAREYLRKVLGHLWTIVVAVAAGILGLVESIDNNLKVPVWIWLTIFPLGLVLDSVRRFH